MIAAPGMGQPIAEVAAAARAGFTSAPLSPSERAAGLGRNADPVSQSADRLAELLHREMGKPLAGASAEVARSAGVMHYFAAEAERAWVSQLPADSITRGTWIRPASIGVVAAITPWTFSITLVAWKLAPAGGWWSPLRPVSGLAAGASALNSARRALRPSRAGSTCGC